MHPEIVFGPPGCGKTTTLLNRVEAALARGTPPDRIGYFSFTRKAAQEATERACEKFSLRSSDFPFFSTIHSMCFKQLGMKRGEVMEGAKVQEFAKYAGIRINGKWSDDGTLTGFETGDRILFMENMSRICNVPLRDIYDRDDDQLPWTQVERVAKALKQFKKAHGLMDFTDMLTEFSKSGIRIKLDDLFVDETQDLSPIQWHVVEKLAQRCPNVAVAGDDDQAIYRWAGADVDHLIDMEGRVNVLGQSYRVPPAIQALAHSVINRVKKRRPKEWKARTGEEGIVRRAVGFSRVDCGEGSTLVLARNTYILTSQVEPALRRQGIVYEKHGHSSINMKLLHVIQSWERLRQGKTVTIEDARQIYQWMSSGVGFKRGYKTLPDREDEMEVSLEYLKKDGGLLRDDPWHEALDKLPRDEVSYIRSARRRGEKITKRPRVVVSTIHGAKGGQADHVVLMKEIAYRSYREIEKNPEDEMRCWYVGITRAKRAITIVEATTPRKCPWI